MLNQPSLGGLQPKPPEPNPFDTVTPDLKKAIQSAKEILVLVRENPKLDHLSSALALYLALSKAGKSVTIACATLMKVEFNRLVGVNKITDKIGNRNLVASFPYKKDSIEKVSYNVDDANFNLVIQPKPGFPAIDAAKVQYSYSGAEADVVFVVGAQKLDDLGVIYQAEKKLFESATIINIDSAPNNSKFAQINLVWNQISSTAEVVTQLIKRLDIALDQDMATNLLAGLNEATQNFQRFNVKPQAFETASKLMQAGGKRPMSNAGFSGSPGSQGRLGSPFGSLPRRFPLNPSLLNSPQAPSPVAPPPANSMPPAMPRPPAPATMVTPQVQPQLSPVAPASPATPPIQQTPQPSPSLPAPSTAEPPLPPAPTQAPLTLSQPSTPTSPAQILSRTSQKTNQSSHLAKDDWLKPKIYKGSTKV